MLGCIVQFGGQTPLKLAAALEAAGIPILGTSPDAIDLAEDRERFQVLLQELGLRQPANGMARTLAEAKAVADKIGYPVVIRPSYVLGGRAMRIVHDHAGLERYLIEAVSVTGNNPVLIDRYLSDASEVDVDCLADGKDVFVAGIMEHIEEAGIHSGDSACSLPPYSLESGVVDEIKRQTALLAKALNVVGLMNVQFAVKDGDIYLLEVNPRASRTVPFVAKATGVPIAKIAARIMAGESLALVQPGRAALEACRGERSRVPLRPLPRRRHPARAGNEIDRRGDGHRHRFRPRLRQVAAGRGHAPAERRHRLRFGARRRQACPGRGGARLIKLGFKVIATHGTAAFLRNEGIEVGTVNKVLEGRPHCVDAMLSGQVQLVVNTTEGALAVSDSFSIRRTALTHSICHYTTLAGARAAVDAIEALRGGTLDVAPLQSYLSGSF